MKRILGAVTVICVAALWAGAALADGDDAWVTEVTTDDLNLGSGPQTHANDWHAALIPLHLRLLSSWDSLFARTRTVLTIHNLVFTREIVVGARAAIEAGVYEEYSRAVLSGAAPWDVG